MQAAPWKLKTHNFGHFIVFFEQFNFHRFFDGLGLSAAGCLIHGLGPSCFFVPAIIFYWHSAMDGPRTIIIYIFRELDLSGDREVV